MSDEEILSFIRDANNYSQEVRELCHLMTQEERDEFDERTYDLMTEDEHGGGWGEEN